MLTWEEFEKIEMRVGTILEVNDFRKRENLPTNSLLISARRSVFVNHQHR